MMSPAELASKVMDLVDQGKFEQAQQVITDAHDQVNALREEVAAQVNTVHDMKVDINRKKDVIEKVDNKLLVLYSVVIHKQKGWNNQ